MNCKIDTPQVQVGLGLIIIKNKKCLVGRRKGSHAAGLISFPGGGLEFGETWAAGGLRETAEECGKNLQIKYRPFSESRLEWFTTNDIMPQYKKHFITLFLVADWVSGEPENIEPHKCDGWEWMNLDEILELSKEQETADWIPANLLREHRLKMGL